VIAHQLAAVVVHRATLANETAQCERGGDRRGCSEDEPFHR
jgi:hypothetical protein